MYLGFRSFKTATIARVLLPLSIASMTLAMGYQPVVQAQADAIVLNQWYHQYGEAGTQDAVQRYADEYHALNPNVTVKVNWILGDYMGDKLPAALQTADAPDVYEVGPFVTADLVQAGLVADLSSIYTPDLIKDFGSSMGFVTIAGKPYGVKMINDSVGIYYRKSVLAAAGLKPPTTMDELIAAAKKLNTNKQSGLFIGNSSGKEAHISKILMYSAGSALINNGQAGFDNARTVAAWTKLKELADSGALLVGNPTDWWDPSALIDGTAAMQLTGLWAMPAIAKALGDDFGVIPWPALDAQGTPTTTLGGWSEVVNGKSKNVDAAKAFVQWLWITTAKDQQDWSVSYGFHIPPRASVAASTTKLASGPAADFVTFVNKYAKLEGDPYWTTAMDQALTDAISNVIANGADPTTEVHNAATKINALLISVKAPGAVATAAATASK